MTNDEQLTHTPQVEEDFTVMGGRSFLRRESIRNGELDGQKGFFVRVSLTSYRSLPLSCLEQIALTIDGKAVDPASMRLVLNNVPFKLDEFGKLSRVWWFILDDADLFVASEQPLAPGKHFVEGLLVTVEPYVTGGRFSFYNSSKKYLTVSEEE